MTGYLHISQSDHYSKSLLTSVTTYGYKLLFLVMRNFKIYSWQRSNIQYSINYGHHAVNFTSPGFILSLFSYIRRLHKPKYEEPGENERTIK